mgnify:FL=1
MVSKTILTSTKWAKASNNERVFYIAFLLNGDDAGNMDREAQVVRGKCFPMDEISVAEVEKLIKRCIELGWFIPYEVKGAKYIHIWQWTKFQNLRADRAGFQYPIFNCDCCKNPLWETTGDQPATAGQPKGNRRSTKKSDKPEASISYLTKLPQKDIDEFVAKFVVTEKEVKVKAEKLKDYCDYKGRVYRNYKSFLRNALRADYKERSDEKSKYDV